MELLRDFDYDAFWSLRRKEQVVHLVLAADENVVTRADIAAVMGIAPCSVTRYVQRYEVHPDDLHPLPDGPTLSTKSLTTSRSSSTGKWRTSGR